jgi:NAD(P)H-hydrate epimerase
MASTAKDMDGIFSHPILSCADAGAWEKQLLTDEAAEWSALQKAGAAIAAAVRDDFKEIGGLPDDARLLVLAGKGNNGGDAFLAAREILAGLPRATADVILFFGESPLRPLARRALESLRQTAGARLKFAEGGSLLNTQGTFSLCLDGVFGFQFRPPVDPATAGLLARVNAHPHIKLRAAVDLPSGVGETNGGTVFCADFTYATGIVKAPVVAEANAPFVGRLRYLNLGFFKVGRVVPDEPSQSGNGPNAVDRVLLPSILQPLTELRPAHTDKRTFGHLFIVGGSRNYPGAVLMAAQAALRSGVGLLTAFVPESLVPEYATHFPEVMWTGWPETAGGGLAKAGVPRFLAMVSRASAVVIGPGLGAEPETIGAVEEIVRAVTCPVLLDADALRPEVLAAAKGKKIICTPHAGEFKRIAGVAGLREFCQASGAVVVQKGSPTRISEGQAAYYSLFGGPVLARGGSGDLLAGLTGGLLAQNPGDLLLAACRGVVWHGLAADLLARDKGQVAVQTTQLFDYLQPALRLADHETT